MKNLKLLNKKYLSIIFITLFLSFNTYSQEPIDIWKLEETKLFSEPSTIENNKEKKIEQNKIYKMQSKNNNEISIEETNTLISKEIKIVGLYDPQENGLNINMWSNSNGDQILNIFKRIDKLNLSKDASEIMDILLLTNAYYPELNISKDQFLEIKSNWLIKNSNYELIEEYIASGHFIKLAPTKINGRKSDNRVTNIRPSVDVVVAYIDVNFDHIKNCVQFLRNHTKITFDFNR